MVYRRQQRRGTDTQMHPTYEKILNTAVDILIEQGFDRFNVQEVLDRADVSRGTLYHHYGDVDALIEAALAASYSLETRANHRAAQELVERCKTPAEFRREVRRFMTHIADIPSAVRLRRVHTIALCQTRPDLDEAIRVEQDENDRLYAELVRTAQEKGFVRADLDPRVGAALIQGFTISRISDEASTAPLSNEDWANLTFDLYEKMIFPPEG